MVCRPQTEKDMRGRENSMKKSKFLAAVLIMAFGMTLAGCAQETANVNVNHNGGIATQEQIDAAKSQLDTAIESLQFSVNGQIYQFPMKMQEMLDAGWTMEKSVQSQLETIDAYTTTTTITLEKKGDSEYDTTKCYITLSNDTGAEQPLGEVPVKKLIISKNNQATLILPQGLTWNSTFEEAVEAYNPPEDHVIDEADYVSIIISNLENNRHMNLNFDAAARTLSEIELY